MRKGQISSIKRSLEEVYSNPRGWLLGAQNFSGRSACRCGGNSKQTKIRSGACPGPELPPTPPTHSQAIGPKAWAAHSSKTSSDRMGPQAWVTLPSPPQKGLFLFQHHGCPVLNTACAKASLQVLATRVLPLTRSPLATQVQAGWALPHSKASSGCTGPCRRWPRPAPQLACVGTCAPDQLQEQMLVRRTQSEVGLTRWVQRPT